MVVDPGRSSLDGAKLGFILAVVTIVMIYWDSFASRHILNIYTKLSWLERHLNWLNRCLVSIPCHRIENDLTRDFDTASKRWAFSFEYDSYRHSMCRQSAINHERHVINLFQIHHVIKI